MRLLLLNYGYGNDTAQEQTIAGADCELVIQPRGGAPVAPDILAEVDGIVFYPSTERPALQPADFPRCRIAVLSSVGFDTLDLDAWAVAGIAVCNNPDYGTTDVADHAIALMLALARGIATYHERLRADPVNGWSWENVPSVRRLRGQTFGVLGLGRIGLTAANRARAFGMRVVFHDPYLPSGAELAVGFERMRSVRELMAASDVISIHTPLTSETRGLIGEEALAHAKPGLMVINSARGAVIDIDALFRALKEGRVAAAGLDVLPKEPAPPDHPLVRAYVEREPWLDGRLILTPHSAFFSPSSLADRRRKAIEVAIDYLRHGELRNCVNRHLMAAAPR